jgi:tetratricopeptide (TPR) repeat protein
VLSVLLALGALVAYLPVSRFPFLGWDDNLYVTANPMVKAGLTPAGVRGAFTSTTAGNWHPLTLLSLELDHTLFGERPAGFHAVNLLLHAATTVLLFLLLRHVSGRVAASAWVAALFGLHPLHVESVAWVAERKDVLAGLWWVVALWAYVWYARAPGRWRYACVTAALALGLMAKSMLVTLPCVFLLLDYWPLRRFAWVEVSPPAEQRPFGSLPTWRLLREKVPWLALVALFSVIAMLAQQHGGALRTLDDRPLSLRLANAVVAYAVYLRQTVWPSGLAAFYPMPEDGWPAWEVAGAAVLLLGLTAVALWQWRRRPYLIVGWLWYVGTLVPVIGLVPVGDQAWADRYTYLPLIGVFIAVAWAASDLPGAAGLPAWAVAVVGALAVVAAGVATRVQLGYWQDDEHLWRHALTVTTRNDFAHNNLGVVLGRRATEEAAAGAPQTAAAHFEEAADQFAAAVEINPRNDNAQVNLARAYDALGRRKEAIERLQTALTVHPGNEEAHVFLGGLYATQGQPDEARRHLEEALRLRPDDPEARHALDQLLHPPAGRGP